MKILLLSVLLLSNTLYAKRGDALKAPFKGTVLSGNNVKGVLTGDVVVRLEDGTIIACDSLAVSKDGNSFVAKGNPLMYRGKVEMRSSDKNAWLKLFMKDGVLSVKTSRGSWRQKIKNG